MLRAIAEAALALTSGRLATSGHGYVSGQQVVGGSARVPGAPPCPPGEMFLLQKGGVHMALAEGAESIRLTDAELRAHARWWGLPEGHVAMRGLLGARMLARDGRTNGMILVTDKEQGDFTVEDEELLRQLATVASLALQHVEARISLEESDRRKNEFLAMLSHELRNPLAPIRNSLFILDRSAPGGEQARLAQSVIDRQVGHLTRLVDDLLDVTRISRGKIDLRREPLDLVDLVRRTVEDYRDTFAKSDVELELSLPGGALWIDADPTRIAQVIGNLLSNSAKFTPAGGSTTVSLHPNPDLEQAVVRVRDTGIGISAEMLPRVFEPFTQADATLDRSRGGLGLGLTMVKGLVEMHGGEVSVQSEGIGKGAEFTVRLPLDLSRLARAAAGSSARAERVSRRVLVIEDNLDAADVLRVVLEMGGHEVAVTFSGPEGVERARSFRPHVVLCDIGLPGMDGYEVARAMRRDPALRAARLVALSGYAAPEDIDKARGAGFDAHVAKPLNPQRLEEVLAGKTLS
jgi:two-component system CheB/CheR fusion protein